MKGKDQISIRFGYPAITIPDNAIDEISFVIHQALPFPVGHKFDLRFQDEAVVKMEVVERTVKLDDRYATIRARRVKETP